MPLYRAYDQPGKPVGTRVFGLEVISEAVKYSKELKTACLLAAGPEPDAPTICPLCMQTAEFNSRVCYKYGIAGAWNMVCCGCGEVHIPMQQGPTEHHLEEIESIRARDIQAHTLRKEMRAQARSGKKSPKSSKPSKKATKADNASSQRPFGIINNAPKLQNWNDCCHKHDSKDDFKAHAMISHGAQHSDKTCRRSITVVLWEKAGEPPFIDRVEVASQDELYLYHNPRVPAFPAATEFERWVFVGNVWSPVPWDISPLEVHADDAVVFVRIMGITCVGFGEQLHAYQMQHGLALSADRRLVNTLYDPPRRHRWVVLWTEDNTPPEVFLFNYALLDDEEKRDTVSMPWLDKLRNAPFFILWHETHTRWVGVLRDQSPEIPDDAPMLLLAHPGVAALAGSGEAIAWFEAWRATRARGSKCSRARNKHPHDSSDDGVPNKRSRDDGGEIQIVEAPRPINASRYLPSSSGSRANPVAISDNEEEFVQGSSRSPWKGKGRAIPPGKPMEALEFDSNGNIVIDLTDC